MPVPTLQSTPPAFSVRSYWLLTLDEFGNVPRDFGFRHLIGQRSELLFKLGDLSLRSFQDCRFLMTLTWGALADLDFFVCDPLAPADGTDFDPRADMDNS